ncbi:MAG TPA: hypothetical protein DD434_02295, partial [Bacteroidales bacterium]|nr:hypothetical protein [Bacteroidales bacterium]
PNSVTSIGEGAFGACVRLISVTLPNSVTSIGGSAFFGCSRLTSITIPNTVTSIGRDAFDNTPYYNNIPNGLVYINNVLYEYKGSITDSTTINIQEGTISISESAFFNCTGLKSVTFPSSLVSIGAWAFSGCYRINSITIPNSVTYIGDRAFSNCTGLLSITIPSSVTTIGGSAFENTAWYDIKTDGLVYINNVLYKYKGIMPANTSINVLSGTVSIAGDAFDGCRNLTSISIPNSVKSIGEWAFLYCNGLTTLTIPNSVTSIGVNAFYDCSGLTSITLPNNINSIEGGTFYNCSGLTSITLPNYVYTIEGRAFYNCNGLTSITLPKYVTYIGFETFAYCNSLNSISSESINPPNIESSTSFSIVNKTIPLYVPCVSLSSYNNARYWSDFTNQIGIKTLHNIDTTICQGSIYTDYGANLNSAGVYTLISGCDSVILILNVNPIPAVPQSLNIYNIAINNIEIGWRGNAESYDVYRDDSLIANVSLTNYMDNFSMIEGETYCYKVKAKNGSGCESALSDTNCFAIVGLENIEQTNIQTKLYPNPTSNKSYLEIEGLTSEADVLVYDMVGRVIKTYKINQGTKELEIDLSGYSKGVYSIRIVNETINQTKKLIVQ